MTVPEIVQSTLDGAEIAARVSLGGDDELFITPSSTVIYRADGLLSDESVDEFPHAADRLRVSEGRRKTTFTLEYALDGERSFSIPASKTDDVLHPVLAGVLNGNGITTAGETVIKPYRFSELTLIITSDRLVKHIGEAVWDDDYEEYHFDDVTNLAFEDGSVATSIVLTVDGRPERIKAPNEQAGDCKERLKRALFEYHDVDSLAELNDVLAVEESEDTDGTDSTIDFGDGVDPLDANPPELDDRQTDANDTRGGQSEQSADPLASDSAVPTSVDASRDRDQRSDDESASRSTAETGELFTDAASQKDSSESSAQQAPEPVVREPAPELIERLEALEATVEQQNDRIEAQQRTIEQLIQELRQGR